MGRKGKPKSRNNYYNGRLGFIFRVGTYNECIAWCFTPFSKLFQVYHGDQCSHGVSFTGTPQNTLSIPWLISYKTIVGIMICGQRESNPVAITFVNPWEKYICRAANRTSDLLFSSRVRYRLI